MYKETLNYEFINIICR